MGGLRVISRGYLGEGGMWDGGSVVGGGGESGSRSCTLGREKPCWREGGTVLGVGTEKE